MKAILGISLVLIMLLVAAPLGYSELLKVQIDQGTTIEEIQCDNPNHVLVKRTNGNLACVSESSAEKKNWIVIKTEFDLTDDKEILDTTDVVKNNEIPILTWDKNDVIPSEFPPTPSMSKWPVTSLEMPSQVTINTPFEVYFNWQYFEEDDDTGEIEYAIENKYVQERNLDDELRVNLLANIEFTNYAELGYKVIRESVNPSNNKHYIGYSKDISYNKEENVEKFIFKVTDPIDNYSHHMSIGTTMSSNNPPPFYATSQGDITSFSTEVPDFERGQYRLDCNEKCQYWKDNVKDDIEFDYLSQYLRLNEIVYGERSTIEENFYNYYYHNVNATLKDFLQREITPTAFGVAAQPINIGTGIDQVIRLVDAKVKADDIAKKHGGLPLDVDLIGEMLTDYNAKGLDIVEVIKSYNFPDWFVDEIFEKYPDLKTQDFLPALNWVLPAAYGAGSVITAYGNAYDDESQQYMSDIKVCVHDWDESNNTLGPILFLDDNTTPACTYTSGVIGSYSISNILSADPDGDGTTADYTAVYYFENENKVQLLDRDDNNEPAKTDDSGDRKTNGASSGYVGLGKGNIDDTSHFLTMFKTVNDIHDYSSTFYAVDKVQVSFNDGVDVNSAGGSYDGNGKITLDGNAWDHFFGTSHEYGHFFADEVMTNHGGNPEAASGCGYQHWINSITCDSLALTEGFANFFAQDYEGTPELTWGSLYNFETRTIDSSTTFTDSSAVEANVAAVFWDIADSTNESDDSDTNKKDDLDYGMGEISDSLVWNNSIFHFEEEWISNGYDSLNHVFYLNTVDATFQGDISLPTTDSFSDDFEDGTLDLWIITGDTDWTVDDDHVSHPLESNGNQVGTSSDCDYICTITMAAGVELSQYTSATLWFDKFIDIGIDADEGLYVYVSEDGGDTWNILQTSSGEDAIYTDSSNDDTNEWTTESYDLDGYLNSDDFKVRFVADSTYYSEYVEVDNIAITGSTGSGNGGGGSNPHDGTAPVITLNGDSKITLNVGNTFSDPGASAEDERDGDISNKITITGSVNINTVGTYYLDYDVSDKAGNAATTVTRTIEVSSSDTDGDGIQDDVDVDPDAVSIEFSDDNQTSGTIVNVGDQVLIIADESDSSLGVIINATETGSGADAELSVCDDATTIFLNTNDSVSVTCGSSSIKVYEGASDVVFYGDDGEIGYATMLTNDKILFEPTKFEFTNTGVNNVTVSVNETSYVISNDGVDVIIDVIAPSLTIPSDKTFEATANPTPLTLTQIGDATATDSNDLNPVIKNNSTNLFSLGDTIILWNATDVSGNTGEATQTITIEDNTKPVVTAPDDYSISVSIQQIPISLDDGDFGNATATDIFSVDIIHNATAPFQLGDTIIEWTATDTSGNSATATQTITILQLDNTAPTITVPADITKEATAVNTPVSLGNATATDDVDSSSDILIKSNSTTGIFPLGNTSILWSATDSSNNTATDIQIITIEDTISPNIFGPENITTEATAISTDVTIIDATATDIFDTLVSRNNTANSFDLGQTVIEWTATDENENTNSTTQFIEIIDETNPIVTAPADVTIEATGTSTEVTLDDATVNEIFLQSFTNNSTSPYSLGNYLVVFTAIDTSGNQGTNSTVVIVQDTTPPVITLNSSSTQTIEVENNYTELGAIARDNIDGDISDDIVIDDTAVDTNTIGSYSVNYDVTDFSGNPATQVIRTVDVVAAPNTNPVVTISSPTDDSVFDDSRNISFDGTANDAEDGNIAASLTWTSNIDGNIGSGGSFTTLLNTGIHTITADVTDSKNGTASDSITVTVSNFEESISSSTGSGTINVKTNAGSFSTISSVDESTLPTDGKPLASFPDGFFSWTITGLDDGQTITPSFTMPNSVPTHVTLWMVINGTWIDASSALGSNDGDETLTISITDGGSFDADGLVNGEISDPSGFAIFDTEAPSLAAADDATFEATGYETLLTLDDLQKNGNATATDNTDPSPIIQNNSTGAFLLGDTIILWNATDVSGNLAEDYQTITVQDTTKPIISLIGEFVIDLEVGDSYIDAGANATDIYDGDLTDQIQTSSDFVENLVGNYTVSYDVKDSSDNVADTVNRTISVTETVIELYCGEPESYYNNVIYGTESADYLKGTNQNDLILGYAGNDFIRGSQGHDCIYAGDGDDFIQGGAGDDTIYGGTGDDNVRTGPGIDLVYGEEGNDILHAVSKRGTNFLFGGDGSDICIPENDKVALTSINCEMPSSTDTIIPAIDELFCGESISFYNSIINGTDSADYLMGTKSSDLILGYGGNDFIRGSQGNDCIYGGDGDDLIQGGAGNDTIYAGNGNDSIRTGGGNDTVYGEAGDDILHAVAKRGTNILDGGNDFDICIPENDNVTFTETNCEMTVGSEN